MKSFLQSIKDVIYGIFFSRLDGSLGEGNRIGLRLMAVFIIFCSFMWFLGFLSRL